MKYSAMGVMYLYEGTIWYLGGIYFQVHLWWWLWWDSREGFWKSPERTNVRPAKQWHGNMVEVDKDRELLGNFQESETKVKPRTIWFKENILKVEKVFQVWENTTKIRDEILGCYKPSPLKKNLVPRFGD